ncbi:MAG: BamA/TamA family outer membrane protein [Deltaproteobacteria bacterium]|nr:BamA/TamA family outer membrane protein [Deltaproteobacteria bacterium]
MISLVRWCWPILFLTIPALVACGRVRQEFPSLSRTEPAPPVSDDLIRSDPEGPIHKPQLPTYQAQPPAGPEPPAEVIKYNVLVEIEPKDLTSVTELFRQTADLFTLADKPILNPMTLSRRLKTSLEKGHQILQSLGYYEGQAIGWLERKDGVSETTAVVKFEPGPVYGLGTGLVTVGQPEPSADQGRSAAAEEPVSAVTPPPGGQWPTADLTEAGWKAGHPAVASDVQAILEQNTVLWAERGYPKAKILKARHYLEPDKKVLSTEVTMDPGLYCLMGALEVRGDDGVKPGYMENLVTWKTGQVWNQTLVDRFVDSLFQTGLFKSVETSMGPADRDGRSAVVVEVADAPLRTVSGSINYDSDFGPGLVMSWEHRDLTGWGDRLRLEMPVWPDLLQLGAGYVRPYFLSRNQNLLIDLAVIHENADAYTLSAASSAVGLERRLSRYWSALFQVKLEAGYLEEFLKAKTRYMITGLPLTFNWDMTDDLLNPSRGTRFKVSIQPYFGQYFRDFEIVKSRVDLSRYFQLISEGRLVLALRGAVGGIWGAERSMYPATLRFFGGGGGSMRGYEYQSVGPRNERDKPDGGGSMAEVSGEFRWRWSETMGATVFVDGGMVYDKPDLSQIGQNFLWGGGVGFRYYTPIGPFRLDLATPLTPRDRDKPLQFYLSLGQSF